MTPAAAVPLMLALLLASAFCSSTETALFALDAAGRAALALRGGVRQRLVARFAARPQTFLLGLLLLNLLVNLAYFTVSGALALAMEGKTAAIGVSGAAFLAVLVLGEIFPKAFAVREPLRIASLTAPVIEPLSAALRPVLAPLRFVTDVLTGMLTARTAPRPLEVAELLALVRGARQRGTLSPTEEEVLARVLQLAGLRARDAMVPRVDIAAVDLAAGRARAEETVRATRRSRLPAYRGSIDHVVGYVEGKDLFLRPRASLVELVRPIGFVSESVPLDAALRLMQAEGRPIAIALDEYGGTAGVLTFEGIGAVLFGGFSDEHQKAGGFFRRREDGAVVLRGTCPITLFNALGLEPQPLRQSRAMTVGGFIAAALDRIPAAGDQVDMTRVRLRVLRVRNGSVRIVLAEPLVTAETGA